MGSVEHRMRCTAGQCDRPRVGGSAYCPLHAAEERGRRRGLKEAMALADEWAARCQARAEEAAGEADAEGTRAAANEGEGAEGVASRIRAFYLGQPPVGV